MTELHFLSASKCAGATKGTSDLALETSIGMTVPLGREEWDIMGQVVYVLQSLQLRSSVGRQTSLSRGAQCSTAWIA